MEIFFASVAFHLVYFCSDGELAAGRDCLSERHLCNLFLPFFISKSKKGTQEVGKIGKWGRDGVGDEKELRNRGGSWREGSKGGGRRQKRVESHNTFQSHMSY